jgi:hypothetical protein
MMTYSKFLLAGVAALALTACGGEKSGDAPKTKASAQAAKLSSASPLDTTFTLKDAEEFDVEKFLALMPDESRPTYESAVFDKALGATVLSNLRFSDAGDGEGVVIERAEFFGVDEAAIDRINSAIDAGPDAPFETVFQKVRLLNISSEGFENADSGERADISIGGVEFDKLSIRQGGVDGNPEGEDGANFLNAMSLGGLYFKDIDVKVAAEEGQDISFNAPDLRFVGMAGGKLDAIIAKDLAYDLQQGAEVRSAMREAMGPQAGALLDGPLGGFIAPESQQATFGTMEWRGLDFSGLVEYGVKGEEPPATARDLIDLGTLKIANMTNFINNREMATVGELDVPVMKFAWLIPSDFQFEVKDAVADYTAYVPDTESPAYNVLKERGLDKVESTGSASWKWNPDKGDGAFSYEALSPGVADMSMRFSLAGANLKEIAAAQEAGSENPFAENAKLKSLSLKVDDEKGLDAIFALAALQMGGTGDDLRQSAPALIRLSGAQVAQMNPRFPDYVDAFADFVAKGGSLEIAASPEEPFGAASLSDGSVAPQALPDVLDLTVTHSE